MADLYEQNLKSPPASPYLEKLLDEKKNLALYVQDLPICNKLLNQEITRVSETPNQSFNDFDKLQIGSPNILHPFDMMMPDFSAISLGPSDGNYGWNPLQLQGFGLQQGPPASPTFLITKKLLRVDVPVDSFPDFNFVGRLLGPRGNSLKRIEAQTGCRLFIRGRGCMKDPYKEECLRGRLWHLNEPLHVLIEAEGPTNVVDAQLRQAQEIIQGLLIPVSNSRDLYKRQQLQELAMLKSLGSSAMKRATRKGNP